MENKGSVPDVTLKKGMYGRWIGTDENALMVFDFGNNRRVTFCKELFDKSVEFLLHREATQ